MIYLTHFSFPDREREYDFTMKQKHTCYDTVYPFLILSAHQLKMLDFEPVTILYGGNDGKPPTAPACVHKRGLPLLTQITRTSNAVVCGGMLIVINAA